MVLACQVIYENGVFRPLEPLPLGLLKEGQRMRGIFDPETNTLTPYPVSENVEESPDFKEGNNGDCS